MSSSVIREQTKTLFNKLTSDNGQEIQISRNGMEQARLALDMGLKHVSQQYRCEAVWQRQSIREKDMTELEFYSRTYERAAITRVIDKYIHIHHVRKVLFDNKYGNITPEMTENVAEWDKYIATLLEAESKLAKALGWLELLADEWKKEKTVFEEFWESVDTQSGKTLRGEKTISLLYTIIVTLTPRKAFLQSQLDRTVSEYEAPDLRAQPKWLEWNILSEQGLGV